MLQKRDMILNGDIVELRSGLRLMCIADRLCTFKHLMCGGGYADLNVDYDRDLKAQKPLLEDDDIVAIYTINDLYLVSLKEILEEKSNTGLITIVK